MLPIAMIGTPEIVVIAVVVVLLFGAKKIPEIARGLREGIDELKKSSKKPAEGDENSNAPKHKQ